jgi:hypothetical protein
MASVAKASVAKRKSLKKKVNVVKASAVKLKREIKKVNAVRASVAKPKKVIKAIKAIKATKKGSAVKANAVAKAKLSSLYDHV